MEAHTAEVCDVEVAIKLFINEKLYRRGAITEEMYERAKPIILRGSEKYIRG